MYLDDLVIHSSSWSQHIARLREVFNHLEAATLTLNHAKCEFVKGTVTYLATEVGRGEVCAINAKETAIATFLVASTRCQLCRFLGMAGMAFCKNCSQVVTPLSSLCSPNQPFIWTDDCQHASDNVKVLLSSSCSS